MRVVEIFDSLQGEGFWAGTPMTFIRLAGCNAQELGLGCVRWCDTVGSWDAENGREMSPTEVSVALPPSSIRRVCVTGGEPLLQDEEFAELVTVLQHSGRLVHVETNGTLDLPPGVRLDWVTVSPKPPRYSVSPGLIGVASEIKVVVDDTDFRIGRGRGSQSYAPDGRRQPSARVDQLPEDRRRGSGRRHDAPGLAIVTSTA